MLKMVSLLPKKRLEQTGILIPDWMQVTFCSDYSPENIIKECQDAKVLLCPPSYPPIGEEIIRKLPKLSLIQSTGAGYDSIDCKVAAEMGIPVANSPGGNSTTVAEYIFALIVALQRNLVIADQGVKGGEYVKCRETLLGEGMMEIRDSTLGVIGLGNIGKEVARLGNFLGAKVYYYDLHHCTNAEENLIGAKYLELKDLLKVSDILVIQVTLNEETRKYLSEKEFSTMKPNAILINAARGGVVDEAALAQALEKGVIKGAAADVFTGEIPDKNNPLLNLTPEVQKKVILTPHIAGVTGQALTRMARQAIGNVERVYNGTQPKYVVNGVVKVEKVI